MGFIIVLLITIRLILPSVLLRYANKALAGLDGYYGEIKDIDLSIYRGAYQIDDIFIDKVDSVTHERVPFFACDNIDLSIEWSALFNGRIVGQLALQSPMLIFTKDKAEPEEVQKDTTDFRQVLDKLMPLNVNRFDIRNGEIHYKDETTTPKVDVKIDRLDVVAQNLSSVRDTSLLPASIRASANVYEGDLTVDMKLNLLADYPTFDLNAELKQTNLTLFNEFFQAYGKIDVNNGTFGLFSEVAAKDGSFKGYVKPVVNDIDVLGPEDKEDNALQKLWEGLTGTIGKALENPKKDQIAAKVPIEGKFDNTIVKTWYAIATVLQNAFIQALYPALDYQINISSVEAPEEEEKKGFLERIFGKDDKEDDDKKEDQKKK